MRCSRERTLLSADAAAETSRFRTVSLSSKNGWLSSTSPWRSLQFPMALYTWIRSCIFPAGHPSGARFSKISPAASYSASASSKDPAASWIPASSIWDCARPRRFSGESAFSATSPNHWMLHPACFAASAKLFPANRSPPVCSA